MPRQPDSELLSQLIAESLARDLCGRFCQFNELRIQENGLFPPSRAYTDSLQFSNDCIRKCL